MKIVDAGRLLDEGCWSGYQKLLIAATALTVVLYGMDLRLVPVATNTMAREWSLYPAAFGIVLSVELIGLTFGGLLGGMLGDRIGRRSALLWSITAFAVSTLAISTINGIPMLGLLRFLSGLGLGGTLPNAAALSFEFAPKRNRASAVIMTMVGIPFGGFALAKLLGKILPIFGWRKLFGLSGIISIVVALILFKVMPESPRFLAIRRERWPELIALLRRLGHHVPADSVFAESGSTETVTSRPEILELFAPAIRLDTMRFLGAFFFCFLANYIALKWLPRMLATSIGFTPHDAIGAVENWNLGGIAGVLIGAFLIQRFGSRWTTLSMSAISIACSIVLVAMRIDSKEYWMIMLVLLGGFISAVQVSMYALAANVYPTVIRGTGIGAVLAVSRISSVIAVYVGAFGFNRGISSYFGIFAIVMALTLVSLALVRNHIERSYRREPVNQIS